MCAYETKLLSGPYLICPGSSYYLAPLAGVWKFVPSGGFLNALVYIE
jgi:hypothetical protein